MTKHSRREFLKKSACAGAAALFVPARSVFPTPMVVTSRRTNQSTTQGKLIFHPYYVQSGIGPHLLDWAYTTDEKWDSFHSNITASKEGVVISDTEGEKKFGIDVRWNVEGFGYIYITANNGGEFYTLPPSGKELKLNLNYELAKSRVIRNQNRFKQFLREGWKPSREVVGFLDLSEEFFADAKKIQADETKRAMPAQKSLFYAMWGSEMMELDKANYEIAKRRDRPNFFIGCDARAFYQMYQDKFLELFPELFNYATITYVVKGDGIINDFEPQEGNLQWDIRDVLFKKLRLKGITIEGRPLFWFHTWVTPDWIKKKSYDELRKYIERHTRDVVSHYPEGMYAWEIMNEFHDWANEVQVTPEQTIELTRLACEVAKDANPKVHRLINNCCPFAEYVQLGQWSGQDAKYPQRTPWEFTKELVDAGVDFTLLGQQMYFPYRDLQDIVLTIERFEIFGKTIQLSEVGAPGGPTDKTIKLGTVGFPKEPYVWHRHWDEELQADWMESVYTLAYSKPYIEAANWFDFVDPYSYIENGGLLRSLEGEKKAAYDRLKKMQERWKNLS